MKTTGFLLLIAALLSGFSLFGQDRKVGGPCEGCEAIFESPIPFEALKSVVLLPDADWDGKKPLGINGVVYKADGRTPAPGVVLYVYHTNEKGIYPKKGDEQGWGRRHGYLRGWMRTNEKGEYKFVTLRPAPYPGRTDPAHIHIIVKEPGLEPYYIDDYTFADDPLTAGHRSPGRGGPGLLKLIDVGNMYKAERNIYLGRNITDYPAAP
ncbi:dioxygenase family protein [Larkinella soli]|uniref:dioxygenase family protein n=1 Tax=Larkinella soli TaxID=1770527 RepID=UPI000FFBBFF2|nr:intradiol ring-cleavage dioxygenase [Larkinella soli]